MMNSEIEQVQDFLTKLDENKGLLLLITRYCL